MPKKAIKNFERYEYWRLDRHPAGPALRTTTQSDGGRLGVANEKSRPWDWERLGCG
ncbi:MAG: hypothetical protein ABSG67_04825 [Thermoguttaceae bacterium]